MGSTELNIHLKPQQSSLVSNTGLEMSRAYEHIFLSYRRGRDGRRLAGRSQPVVAASCCWLLSVTKMRLRVWFLVCSGGAGMRLRQTLRGAPSWLRRRGLRPRSAGPACPSGVSFSGVVPGPVPAETKADRRMCSQAPPRRVPAKRKVQQQPLTTLLRA